MYLTSIFPTYSALIIASAQQDDNYTKVLKSVQALPLTITFSKVH